MRTAVCAVRDGAMQAFAPPMFVPSPGVAVRSFTNEVNRADEKNVLYVNSDDFELHFIAYYDEESGSFVPLEGGSRVLCRAKDVKSV